LLEVTVAQRVPGALVRGCACALILLVGACAPTAVPLPADPGVTFAAHRIHGGLMIDEMRGGEPTVIGPPSWLRLSGEATYVVPGGSDRGEGLWVVSPGHAVVRRTLATDSPLVGAVDPSWDDNAIRLALEPAGHPPLTTDVFARADVAGGMSVLGRTAQLSIDVPGTYRATLRDPSGKPVGWIQVAIGLHQPAPEMYEAVLPPDVDEGLAAASAAALESEIDWIEDHAYDVYGGTELR
jgi:hypothetical protein